MYIFNYDIANVSARSAAKAASDATAKEASDQADAAKTAAEAAKAAAKAAAEALTAAKEKVKDGLLGLSDWLLTRADLTEDEIEDIKRAKWEYDSPGTEKMNRDYIYDSYSLDNLKAAMTLLDEVNKVRAADENFKNDKWLSAPVSTNFRTLFYSASATNYAREHMAHGGTNECLAWTEEDAAAAVKLWQDEKATFDELCRELKMTPAEAVKSYWYNGDFYKKAKEVAATTNENGSTKEVGHYVLLHSALGGAEQVWGAGVSSYQTDEEEILPPHVYEIHLSIKADQSTADYLVALNTSKEAEEAYWNSGKKREYTDPMLSTDTIRRRISEYLSFLSIDGKSEDSKKADQAVKDAEMAQTKAEEKKTAARKLAEAAQAALDAAEAVQKSATDALDKAKAKTASMLTVFTKAEQALTNALAEKETAQSHVNTAKSALEQAVKDASSAKEAQTKAAKVLEDARANVIAKQAALAKAQAALDDLVKNAEARLDRLTKETKDARDARDQAQAALDKAEQAQKAAAEALTVARKDANEKAEVLTQKTAAKEAAAKAKTAADEAAEKAHAVLDAATAKARAVHAAYEKADQADQAAKAAAEALADAKSAYQKAQDALSKAKDHHIRAQALTLNMVLNATVNDPEFSYLNAYGTAYQSAKTTAETAASDASRAHAELTAAQQALADASTIADAADRKAADAKAASDAVHQVYDQADAAEKALREAQDAYVKASEALTTAKAKDALARTITLVDVLSARVTADGFTYLNQFGEAYQKAVEKAKNAQTAYQTARADHAAAQKKADELNRQVQIRKAAEEAVRKAEAARKAEEARKAAEARRIAAQKAAKINAVKMPHVEAEEATTAHPNAIAATVTQTAAQPSVSGTVRTEPVKTADNAPVIPYAGSAAVASLLAMGLFLVRTRKDPDVM